MFSLKTDGPGDLPVKLRNGGESDGVVADEAFLLADYDVLVP